MPKNFTCTIAGCNKVFVRAYELKKHVAVHKDPNSVFYCPYCTFFTLQKKNLGIHIGIHTGEKPYHCTHVDVVVNAFGVGTRENPCRFRTNDPAALTKHRKKVHRHAPARNGQGPTTLFPLSGQDDRTSAPLEPDQYVPSTSASQLPYASSTTARENSGGSTATASPPSDSPTARPSSDNVDGHTQPKHSSIVYPLPDDADDHTRSKQTDSNTSGDDHSLRQWLANVAAYTQSPQALDTYPNDHRWSEDVETHVPPKALDAFDFLNADHVEHLCAGTGHVQSASWDASSNDYWGGSMGALAPSKASDAFGNGPALYWPGNANVQPIQADSLRTSYDHAPHPWEEWDAHVQSAQVGPSNASTSTSVQATSFDVSGNYPTWLGNAGPRARSVPADPFDASTYNAYILTRGAAVTSAQGMDLNSLNDPTLDPNWLATYEQNYTNPDQRRVEYNPQPFYTDCFLPDTRTGREGSMCPEWMVDAGVPGWDQSVLDAHKEFYMF